LETLDQYHQNQTFTVNIFVSGDGVVGNCVRADNNDNNNINNINEAYSIF